MGYGQHAGVHEAFLEEIEEWRKQLAGNLALRNGRLNEQELNFATQRIIDRIIFLRICEDRGVEPMGHLQQLLGGEKTYSRLVGLFRAADAKYNSGLFHFKREAGRDAAPDEFTPGLEIDDGTLKSILKRLYYPESPYEFSVVSADILGSVYERFLGKVITLTAGHRARIEPKPEVRKAGGVYYTPGYIVDYIVKQTVGKVLSEAVHSPVGASLASGRSAVTDRSAGQDSPLRGAATQASPLPERTGGLTPREAGKLKILDPACGSGSFLLGAYQYLLDWHLRWYVEDGAEKWSRGKNATIRPADRPALAARVLTAGAAGALEAGADGKGTVPISAGGVGGEGAPRGAEMGTVPGHWALTTGERKRILLDNIHGVDIDYQAVEVTKLSLLLRCLEGETAESLWAQLTLFRERALPDLGKNIVCGNSLIGN